MKFDKIVGFGDSWMYGDELLDPQLRASDANAHTCFVQNTPYREHHCFLGRLGEHYGVPTENFGFPGSSLQSAIWTMLWWLQHEANPQACLVLVGLTDASRTSFYNPNHVSYSNDPDWNKHVHSAWAKVESETMSAEWRHMVKQHLVLTDCRELHRLNYQQATMFFQGAALQRGFGLVQFNIMPAPVLMELDSLMSPDRDFRNKLLQHQQHQRRTMTCEFGHPNELGHQYLAHILQTHIDRVIINQ